MSGRSTKNGVKRANPENLMIGNRETLLGRLFGFQNDVGVLLKNFHVIPTPT